jgi:hypothetical protein
MTIECLYAAVLHQKLTIYLLKRCLKTNWVNNCSVETLKKEFKLTDLTTSCTSGLLGSTRRNAVIFVPPYLKSSKFTKCRSWNNMSAVLEQFSTIIWEFWQQGPDLRFQIRMLLTRSVWRWNTVVLRLRLRLQVEHLMYSSSAFYPSALYSMTIFYWVKFKTSFQNMFP